MSSRDAGDLLRHKRELEEQAAGLSARLNDTEAEQNTFRLSDCLVRGHAGRTDRFISVVADITECELDELVPDTLTARETEVLRLVAEGWTSSRITQSLGYSKPTIKRHVRRGFVKLGVAKRAEAAHRAVQIVLNPPPIAVKTIETHKKPYLFDALAEPDEQGRGVRRRKQSTGKERRLDG